MTYKNGHAIQFSQEIEYLWKVVDLSLLLKIWVEILVKIYVKTYNKFSKKLLDYAKQCATGNKTASKTVILKAARGTGDLIGDKTADQITRVSKTSWNNKLETNEEEILRERYILPELRQNIINDLS